MILVDYFLANECKNDHAFHTCHKCGKCGRVFDEYGLMIDGGGTTVSEDDDD